VNIQIHARGGGIGVDKHTWGHVSSETQGGRGDTHVTVDVWVAYSFVGNDGTKKRCPVFTIPMLGGTFEGCCEVGVGFQGAFS